MNRKTILALVGAIGLFASSASALDVVRMSGSWTNAFNPNVPGGNCILILQPSQQPSATSSASSLTHLFIGFSGLGKFVGVGLPENRRVEFENELNAQDSFHFHQSLLLYFPDLNLTSLASSGTKLGGPLALASLPNGEFRHLLDAIRKREEITLRLISDFIDDDGNLTPFFATHTVFTYSGASRAVSEFENCFLSELDL